MKVVAQEGFQVGLGDRVGLGDFEELKDKRVAEQIAGLGNDPALRSKLENGVLVFSGGDTEE